jgi:hypothetical protein
MHRSSWKQVDERAEAIELLYRERYGRFRDGVATITGDRESVRGRRAGSIRACAPQAPELSRALHEPDRDPVLAEALRSLPEKRRLIVSSAGLRGDQGHSHCNEQPRGLARF